MESVRSGIRLRKTCPICEKYMHLKRAVCDCGHAFSSKRKASCCAVGEPKRKTVRAVKCEKVIVMRKE